MTDFVEAHLAGDFASDAGTGVGRGSWVWEPSVPHIAVPVYSPYGCATDDGAPCMVCLFVHLLLFVCRLLLVGCVSRRTGSNCRLGPRDEISAPLAGTFGGARPAPPRSVHGMSGAGGPSPMAGLDAYSRHKKFINDYVISLGPKRVERYLADRQPAVGKTDYDILQENHKFIREPEDDDMSNWEVRMAVKYYSKLFKEYCIADMSRYKTGQIGLRWRTQKEVFSGDGQFRCGNQACKDANDLKSYEMNFVYKEHGEMKEALVKLRLCPQCGVKLNYKKLKERERELKREAKVERKEARKRERRKRKRRSASASASSSSESDSSDGKREQDTDVWQQVVSKSSGKTYWYNLRTGDTQWSAPDIKRRGAAELPAAPPSSAAVRARGSDDVRSKTADGSGYAEGAEGSPRKKVRGNEAEPSKDACHRAEEFEHNAGAQDSSDVHGLWSKAPKELVADDEDEFDEYFKGMFP